MFLKPASRSYLSARYIVSWKGKEITFPLRFLISCLVCHAGGGGAKGNWKMERQRQCVAAYYATLSSVPSCLLIGVERRSSWRFRFVQSR